MAYRVFTDSSGTDWQAWDVIPKAGERRLADRRLAAERVAFPDRRVQERRVLAGRWTLLSGSLRDGWLCFEGAPGRRRLTPIPGDWDHCAESTLEHYCRSATPVRISSPSSGRR
jgi:hypothetical protein